MNAVFQGRKMDTIERRDLALVRVSRYGSIFCNDDTISYDLLERMRLLEEIRNLPNESFDNIPF